MYVRRGIDKKQYKLDIPNVEGKKKKEKKKKTYIRNK